MGRTVLVEAEYQEPFNFEMLLRFFAARAVAGVESVSGDSYTRSLGLPNGTAVITLTDIGGAVRIAIRGAAEADLPLVVTRVRSMLDLDCDPKPIDEILGADPILKPWVQRYPGMRLPGNSDTHEMLFRAIIGQQITVKAATGMLSKMATQMPDIGIPGTVNRLFPTAEIIAATGYQLYSGPKSRREALRASAEQLAAEPEYLSTAIGGQVLAERLLSLKGVGQWTASYVAMRTLGSRDVFLASDSAVKSSLRKLGFAGTPEAVAARFKPFRSYFTLHLWNANGQTLTGRQAPPPAARHL